MQTARSLLLLAVLLGVSGCATLGQAILPPRFDVAENRTAELRLIGPSVERPLGGAAIRLWAHVENPNPFGLTLARLAGTLALEGSRAAQVDFPLGLPLRAGEDTVIPLDIVVSLADIPGLAEAARRAATGEPIGYELVGTVGVDAGLLGQPSFGPMTLLQGSIAR